MSWQLWRARSRAPPVCILPGHLPPSWGLPFGCPTSRVPIPPGQSCPAPLTFFVEEGEEFLHELSFHHLPEEVVLLPQLLRRHVLLPASHPLVVVQQFNEACVGGFGEELLIDVFVEPRKERILHSAGKP